MTVPRPQTIAGWAISAVIVIGSATACGLFLIRDGIDPARAYLAGTPGWVSVSECHWQEQKPRGWDCHGTFNGQGITINNVKIRNPLATEPENPVKTVVTGPNAGTAWTPGPTLLLPITSGTFILCIAPFFAIYYWWRGRRERIAEEALKQRERQRLTREIADLRKDLRDLRADLGDK